MQRLQEAECDAYRPELNAIGPAEEMLASRGAEPPLVRDPYAL